ncbi:MAG: quinolinate synthase NadA [Acidaminobacter sp.]|uniref:quinolinate synthase NadA n=1 Tax=Acidaminobacter sp. TaxID=1872102 RepID=UPI001381BB63|nr:quinolinate synthase NadA [Acidaminobacter sp.]MZQ96761.1 quinolinate synthase NadA [Acidaminobacter sp.]
MSLNLIERILKLKEEKNALIMAHNYQIPEVQEIADVVGDSYMLAKYAQSTDKDCIIFCGVHFMAESAKILNPSKKVILANPDAGCPMADMVEPAALSEFKKKYPGVPVVAYVNTSAEVKALSDLCCTSSNAVSLIKAMKEDKIIFLPDRNLGRFVAQQIPEKEVILWDGFCITHERVEEEDVIKAIEAHPESKVLMHPECNPAVWKYADYMGSTAQIIDYAAHSEDQSFIIGTEAGILHSLKKVAPEKTFHLLSGCLVCQNMKKTTLADVEKALNGGVPEIVMEEDLRQRAEGALLRMLNPNG